MPGLNFWKFTKGINLSPQSGAPSSPSNGDVYYNSSTNLFQFYQNGSFVSFNPGTGFIKADGSVPLTSNWSAGAFSATFNSVAVGSAANTVSGLSTIINSGTLTLPTSTDTLVGRATTDTLTNKTLTLPVIASISNGGTVTIPSGADTLVARTSTDTLTNKTISGSSNTLSNIADGSLSTSYLKSDGSRSLTGPLTETQQTTPANPSAGSNKLYFKSDDKLYSLTSAGVETALSSAAAAFLNNGNSFGATATLGTADNNDLNIITNNVVIATFKADGRFALGTAAGSGIFTVNFSAAANPITASVNQRGLRSTFTGSSGGTTLISAFSSGITTAATAYTVATRAQYESTNITKGAGSTITRDIAYYGDVPTNGTNNAFVSDNITYTGNWGINIASTNANLLTGATAIGGTATNNNAAVGFVGEYVESVISSTTSVPGATAVWANLTSISLSAGDWDVDGIMSLDNANSAAITQYAGAISINSGTTTTDQIDGSNQGDSATPGAAAIRTITIPSYRLSLSTTTTVYLKMNVTYTVATPQYRCRISARRAR